MAKDGLRAIIFDIGRVLVRIDLARAQNALADGSRLSAKELWSAIEKDPQWKDWQQGRLSARDWHQKLCQRFGMTLGFEAFVKAWNSALDPTPIHPDTLFAHLARHYRLGLLSNTDPIHVAYLEKTYSFYEYFPKTLRIYSCAVGACKPQPLVFQEALRACKVKASEAVFIDDIAAFADAARALGIHGIPYASPEQLREDFARLGIHTER
jgi:putative hydrolase of the HAD superfamily